LVVLTLDLLLESISQSNVSVGGADFDLTLRTQVRGHSYPINGVGPKSATGLLLIFTVRILLASIFEVHFAASSVECALCRSKEVKEGHTNKQTCQVIIASGFVLQGKAK
jgi:hypothetical protein